MPTTTFSTYDGSFTVQDPEAAATEDLYLEDIGLWRNGLVEVRTPGIAGIVCGKTDHPAEVTLEALDGPPGDPADEWEAVVEVSMFTTSGRLQVHDWDGPPVEGLMVEVEPGPIGVRVSARDRDSEEREYFLIEVWSEEPEAFDEVIRTDHFAQQFHKQ